MEEGRKSGGRERVGGQPYITTSEFISTYECEDKGVRSKGAVLKVVVVQKGKKGRKMVLVVKMPLHFHAKD